MPGSSSILIYLLVFAFVIFRVGSRAYLAYTRQYKTWPILAVLGVLYVALFMIRSALHVISPVFTFVSIGIWILSMVIFKMSGSSYSSNARSAAPAISQTRDP